MDNKKRYIKLLTKEDVMEILQAGGIKLLPDSRTYAGEKIPSIQRTGNVMLCRAKTTKKNEALDFIIKAFAPLISEPQYYNTEEVIVFIYNFSCQVADFKDTYSQENIDMTLKLKEILSQKDKDYLNDFKKYWEEMGTEENEEEDDTKLQ